MIHIFGTTVDLGPFISILASILLTVLTAATPFIVQRILAFFKLSGDAKAREALETAINNGLALARARIKTSKAEGLVISPEDEKTAVVAAARAYAEPKVPDAIKRLKVSDHLDEVIEARASQPKPDATVNLTSAGGASSP